MKLNTSIKLRITVEETMNFANTRRLLVLWIGAFVGAFFLHVVLGAQFYFQSIGISNGVRSSAMMLAFAQEIVYSDIDLDFSDIETDLSNIRTEPEILQPDFSEQESEILETVDEVQPKEFEHIVEKDDFTVQKPLEEALPQKIEHKALVKKTIPMPKAVVKRAVVKAKHSSTTGQRGNAAALEDALLMQWLAKVQAQLERQKEYVVGQRTSRAKGVVKLEFRIHEQGSIFSSRVVVSAGDPELDRLAMAALQRVGNFPPPPASKVNKIIRVSLIFS